MKHPQTTQITGRQPHTDERCLDNGRGRLWLRGGEAGGCSRVARNTLIKYKLTIKLLQIYANICSASTPHTGGKLMGKHLRTAGSIRGLRAPPDGGGGGFAVCS